MGTRADFYIKKRTKLVKEDWIGSIAWDGYPEGIPGELLKATDEKTFTKEFKKFIKEREDFTSPEEGWPWPWDSSGITDYFYVFTGKKVVWNKHTPPDMSEMKNVQMGKKSGIIIMSQKEAV